MKTTLYKKDSKDKIRIWNIEYNEIGELIQESGLEDGKLVKHIKQCIGKNIGKSNETTPKQQAIFEMKSEINSKLTEGYFETKEEAEKELVILPMLANDYFKQFKKIDWNNCFSQPKLDGQRCLIIIKNKYITLLSRDGKIIQNMDHISDEFSKSNLINENIIFDGELYIHGKTFQENMKLIKKYRQGESEKVKFHCYDIINNYSYSKRHSLLCHKLMGMETVEIVDTTICDSEEALKISHSINIQDGYEGSIIRYGSKGYEMNKRSNNLLKYKDFQDIDAEIIDILPNEANPKHGTPLLKYSVQKLDGISESIFKAGVKMSHEDRENLLSNKTEYIGKIANIRFFEWTDDGNPRFPVMVGIHEDR